MWIFPFAYKNFHYSKTEIFTKDGDNHYDSGLNYIISNFIIPFTQKIEFSEETKLAMRFYPNGINSKVIVDPDIQFGRPTIKGTRITTDIIHEMLMQKTDIQDIAFWYDLEENTINDISNFYKRA